MRCGRAFGSSILFSLFLLIARPLNNQNHGNLFLKTQCHIQRSSGQDESILAVETLDLDVSSLLVSSKLDSTIRLWSKTRVLLMIPPLLSDSRNYNNGMTHNYEISRECYVQLCHPTFRRCLSIRGHKRHKRHKRRCTYYSGSSATFHPLLTGDLIFKLNPGPTEIRAIPVIVSSREVNVNNNNYTVASTGVRRNIKNLIRITCCHNNRTPPRLLKFCLWNCQSVRNKTAVFQEYLFSNKIDVCASTETWLSSDDEAVRAEWSRWGRHHSVISQRTVCDFSHCWGKDLV